MKRFAGVGSELDSLILVQMSERFVEVTELAGLGGLTATKGAGNGRDTGTEFADGCTDIAVNILMLPTSCTDLILPAWCAISVLTRCGKPDSLRTMLKLDVGFELPCWQTANAAFVVGRLGVCSHSRAVSHRA